MKKSTLVVLLLAAALGGYVYYSEFRHPAQKPAADASKPLYTFLSDDITSIQITRPGESAAVTLERSAQGWVLTSPVQTRADQTNADTLANSLAQAASSRTLPADPARMKEYGLEPPAASVEIHLKKGPAQTLELGAKDFSGMDVYARQGGAKDLLLIPDTVLTEATRPLLDLRDRAVLELSNWTVTELDFHTPKTKFRLEKKGDYWNLTEPQVAPADSDGAASLSNTLSGARFTEVADEQAPDRAAEARYGLMSPELKVHVRNEQGSEGSLLIGKKDGNTYYARDAGRSLVFRVEDSLVKKFLDASVASLRDKHILRAKADDFSQLAIRNEKLTLKATRSADGKWQVAEPTAMKGKTLDAWHVFEPLNTTKATEVIEHPGAAILARLAKPAVAIKLTTAKGAVTTVVVSAKDGNAVYARSSVTPAVFKMDPYTLVQLNFTTAQAVR
jgi:Domain of unknown function (DUF4340)